MRYLVSQRGILDGRETPLVAGAWAIFGLGNAAVLGAALWEARESLPTPRCHNEQLVSCV